MASSLTLYGPSYEGRSIYVVFTQTKDVANNRSKITWTLYSQGGASNSYTIAPTTITINGVTVYSKDLTRYYTYTFPATQGSTSGTYYLGHDAAGNLGINVGLTSNIYEWTPLSYSANWMLDKIDRYATISSAPNFTDLDNPVVQYSNPAGTNASNLEIGISLAGSTDDIAYRHTSRIGSSYTFSLTDAERSLLRTNTTGASRKVYFLLKTTISGTAFVQTKQVTFSVRETDDSRPTASITVSPSNGDLPSKFSGVYIKGRSRVTAAVTASAKYGASIGSYAVTIDGKTYASASFTSDILSNASNAMQIGCTVTDSRGFRVSPDPAPQIKVYDYSNPMLTNVAGASEVICYRGNASGAQDNSSNRIFVKARKQYSGIDVNGSNINDCVLKFRYRGESSSTWSGWTTLTTSNDEYNAYIPGEFPISNAYTFELSVADDIGTADTISFDIPTEDIPLHLGEGGKAVGLGRYADTTRDYNISFGWDVVFNRKVEGIFPVGSIHISVNNVNPSVYFGGTWEPFAQGKFLVGVSTDAEFATVEQTGGEKAHTLTAAEQPSVTGSFLGRLGQTDMNLVGGTSGAFSSAADSGTRWENRVGGTPEAAVGNTTKIVFNNGGTGAAHNNLPPYITCYMWKRTA